MAEESDSQAGEKTEEPSSYRLEEFRKRGEVASSKELTSALVLGGCFFVLSFHFYIYLRFLVNFLFILLILIFSRSFESAMIKDVLKKSLMLSVKGICSNWYIICFNWCYCNSVSNRYFVCSRCFDIKIRAN